VITIPGASQCENSWRNTLAISAMIRLKIIAIRLSTIKCDAKRLAVSKIIF
jgi:hypothetical protein